MRGDHVTCRGYSAANLKVSVKGAGINWDFTWGKRQWRVPFFALSLYLVSTDQACVDTTSHALPLILMPGLAKVVDKCSLHRHAS